LYWITKDFTFSASHRLSGLPEGHPCTRTHGHNYVVRIELSGERLDDAGMLLDYRELAPFGQHLDDVFDHRDLNDILVNPTAEAVAEHLWKVVPDLVPRINDFSYSIGLSETPTCWAWFGG